MDQLRELVARIVSRPLDRNRPLWEVYFVEGLEDGRVAVLSKAHQALVDGAQIVDLAQVLLDRTPERRELGADEWHPGRPVSSTGLLVEARPRHRRRRRPPPSTRCAAPPTPGCAVPTRPPAGSARSSTRSPNRRSEQDTPITGTLSQQRRFVTVRRSLADHRGCATRTAAPSTT